MLIVIGSSGYERVCCQWARTHSRCACNALTSSAGHGTPKVESRLFRGDVRWRASEICTRARREGQGRVWEGGE
eukprot:1302310-Rhodomonas_salina.1